MIMPQILYTVPDLSKSVCKLNGEQKWSCSFSLSLVRTTRIRRYGGGGTSDEEGG